MSIQRFLTGITPSGTPHLGNYVGAIRPSVQASLRADVQNFYFLADYHALIKVDDPARIQRSTMEIAASWLASGLDPERVTFYRQSDIPEIAELTWLLTCVTSKGLLNRAHAYKAAVDQNTTAQQEPDAEISAGLFMYPVLMAADILMFKAHQVPVGRDQVQHIEMARDIAQRFNHLYGEHLTLPQALIEDNVATLPGLDGRKMSKSYDNHIPLFAPRQQLKKLVAGILTDSRAPGEPKETEGSALFQIYQAFASAEETATLRQAYLDGISWADAKQVLFERIDREMAPMRERYTALMAAPDKMEEILRAGAQKARKLATPFTAELRHAVGLRDLRSASASVRAAKTSKAAVPSVKQYRESDGKFYFKLQESAGRVLLQSTGFATPQEVAKAIALLREQGTLALGQLQETFVLQPGISADDVLLALQQMDAAQ